MKRSAPYCPYRSYCDRGGKAGMLDDVDAETETVADEFNLNFEQIAEIEF